MKNKIINDKDQINIEDTNRLNDNTLLNESIRKNDIKKRKEIIDKERAKQKSGFINRSERFPSGSPKPIKGAFLKKSSNSTSPIKKLENINKDKKNLGNKNDVAKKNNN